LLLLLLFNRPSAFLFLIIPPLTLFLCVERSCFWGCFCFSPTVDFSVQTPRLCVSVVLLCFWLRLAALC